MMIKRAKSGRIDEIGEPSSKKVTASAQKLTSDRTEEMKWTWAEEIKDVLSVPQRADANIDVDLDEPQDEEEIAVRV